LNVRVLHNTEKKKEIEKRKRKRKKGLNWKAGTSGEETHTFSNGV